MNPIWTHRLTGIHLEQRILHKFGIDWEFIIPTVMVLQLRAVGPPEPITGSARGKSTVCFLSLKLIDKPLVQLRYLRCQLRKEGWAFSVDLKKTYSMCFTSQKLEEGFFPTFPEIFTHLLSWSMGNWSPKTTLL